jgi:hypothetical protein
MQDCAWTTQVRVRPHQGRPKFDEFFGGAQEKVVLSVLAARRAVWKCGPSIL